MSKRILFTVITCALAQLATAQDSATANTLDEVVITATKTPARLSETGKIIKVITKEQIAQSAGKDLSQLLNEQIGITVNGATSNPGKDKSLFLLGATDKYTLLLLDGIPLNEPAGVGGSFDLRLLSLQNIERIEILQGSQSTLYGSNAVAGVINIISKKSVSKQPQLNGLLTYGSYNTFKGNAGVSQKTKLVEYNVNYTYTTTDGISEAKDTAASGFDKDGFKQHALQAMAGINLTGNLKLSPYYRFTQFKGGYDADAFTDAPNHYTASLINAGVTGNYNYATGRLQFNYGHDYTKRNYQSQYAFQTAGGFNHAEVFANQKLNNLLQMVAGISYQTYKLKDVDTTNNIFSPYITLLFHTNKGLNVEAGGRYNHHNKYGSNFTYSFNPSYLISNSIKLFANVTSGFRAPSINELFGPFGANPNLKPEKSSTQEAGIQTFLLNKILSFTINGFNRNVTDIITYDFVSNQYINLDKQHDYGAELDIRYALNKKLDVNATYAYISGKITDKTTGKDSSYYNLIRRPKNAVKLSAGYNITSALRVSTSLQYNGKRTDNYYDPVTFEASQVSLKAYTIWNAYVQYGFLKNKLNVFADFKNITNNKDYYEVYGYSVQGTTVTAGLQFSL